MNITLDFGTAVVTAVSIAVGWYVYRRTAPAVPTTPLAPAVGMTTGERLVAALTAAVAVITIGHFATQGVKGVDLPQGGPGPAPTVTSKDLTVISPAPTNNGTTTGN
ncbi:hypothetical protein [Streptomyces sp. NPDC001621]|uniref:hypothetical protein n=1 Tax=Streptomyces sp. NPDC001621 TaxID=3364594 RepID=UPI0036BDDD4E